MFKTFHIFALLVCLLALPLPALGQSAGFSIGDSGVATAEPWNVDSLSGSILQETFQAPVNSTGRGELTLFAGISGSKQPQDFGVNANFGGQVSINWSAPLAPDYGIGFQAGTNLVATDNAVQVFELLGETTGRTQSFTSVGLFQRLESGWSWGFTHDYLYQNYFDEFGLSQWRARVEYAQSDRDHFGVSAAIRGATDSGVFGTSTSVSLSAINQMSAYWRHFWETGAQTTMWAGIADSHGEDNAVTGPALSKDNQFLFGADLLMPLNDQLAIYGEANIILPSDTGTVDAFLGIQFQPKVSTFSARRKRFSSFLPLASPTTFSVDLR